jgi:hypothetical protein
MSAQRRACLLADDGDHRHAVELGVIEAVREMDRAGAGRRQTDTGLAGQLGVAPDAMNAASSS